jgi:hypothetical protein
LKNRIHILIHDLECVVASRVSGSGAEQHLQGRWPHTGWWRRSGKSYWPGGVSRRSRVASKPSVSSRQAAQLRM